MAKGREERKTRRLYEGHGHGVPTALISSMCAYPHWQRVESHLAEESPAWLYCSEGGPTAMTVPRAWQVSVDESDLLYRERSTTSSKCLSSSSNHSAPAGRPHLTVRSAGKQDKKEFKGVNRSSACVAKGLGSGLPRSGFSWNCLGEAGCALQYSSVMMK